MSERSDRFMSIGEDAVLWASSVQRVFKEHHPVGEPIPLPEEFWPSATPQSFQALALFGLKTYTDIGKGTFVVPKSFRPPDHIQLDNRGQV